MVEETENQEQKKMNDKEIVEESIPTGTKYSVVLKFWSVPHEIPLISMVLCEHKITKQLTYKFLDSEGRIWHDVPINDVIRIQNYPNKEDIESYSKLLQESKKAEEQAIEQSKNVPLKIEDVNIG